MRSGVGLLTTHIASSAEILMHVAIPESMLNLDKHKNHFSNIDEISKYSAIGIGCGLGMNSDTAKAIFDLLEKQIKIKIPIVIDADAINLLSLHDKIYLIPENSILTPHVGEIDRLLKLPKSTTSFQRLKSCINFSIKHKCIMILKGANTAICLPDGNCHFNSTGNSGMATAGSGDVLTGLILGLLSQGYEEKNAAILGVYLHGLAGDIALKKGSRQSLIASDIIDCYADAFNDLINHKPT